MTTPRVICGDALEGLRDGVTDLRIPVRDKRGWAKGIVSWKFEGWWFQSVPFTWLLPDAARFAMMHEPCVVGGPAVKLMPEYIGQWAEVAEEEFPEALRLQNPNATRTTWGCRKGCPFCAVAKIEGPLQEIDEWPALPVVVDSNFLQCGDAHFSRVVESLRETPEIDFNSGFDKRLFKGDRAAALAGLDLRRVSFSWDFPNEGDAVLAAIDEAAAVGIKPQRIVVLCLVNFGEDPNEALYRMKTVKATGAQPFAMRYQPLDALRKNDYLAPEWNSRDLKWFCRYWNRQAWLEHVEFKWPSKGPRFKLEVSA